MPRGRPRKRAGELLFFLLTRPYMIVHVLLFVIYHFISYVLSFWHVLIFFLLLMGPVAAQAPRTKRQRQNTPPTWQGDTDTNADVDTDFLVCGNENVEDGIGDSKDGSDSQPWESPVRKTGDAKYVHPMLSLSCSMSSLGRYFRQDECLPPL